MKDSEAKTLNLIEMFVAATQPEEYNMTLKFKTLNQTVFEIELTANHTTEFQNQVYEMVKQSVEAATYAVMSAK